MPPTGRYVLSSAVIPGPGTYRYRRLNETEARVWLARGPFTSYVGYAITADAMHLMLNVRPDVNRQRACMWPGDEALVFRVKERVSADIKWRLTPEYVAERSEIGLLTRER